ncbi:4-(cytidine 5'-diphospho)-2-C-methyl-D-erythritol kinase [Streptomyces sp. NPDC047046]|uniref:4-(cytidine 5'-diphospho)-2-C-methyl-D-erythritol kinase n=1 Tax=Streptomyces sp. NPDC047046 TaxID=3155378 RepID=UPI0033D55820
MSAPAVTVRVPAKVNVQLAVGPARPDGFHDLANIFLAVGLYDEVTATPAERLRLTCEGPGAEQVPLDESNLAARAALALAKRAGRPADVHLHIAKDIPVAGGMAGGSADAAGALLACETLWRTGASRDELLAICAELGSDVPFSYVGGAALGTGRGERLTPLAVGGTFHWVFAQADGGLSTPAVYGAYDRLAETEGRTVPAPEADRAVIEALASGDAKALAAAVHNDLQAAALDLFPALRRTLDAGTEAGALAALVSGSGPTTAFLAPDADSARTIARALTPHCRTARVTTAPAPGAVVVGE